MKTVRSGAALGLIAAAAACSFEVNDGAAPVENGRARFGVASQSEQEKAFTAFESGQVRPLALTPDGKVLFAVNTPDNRLEVFHVNNGGLHHAGSTPVGLEPVAVAARSNSEVWVVNHLSDSISIVDVSKPQKPFVSRTLLVGDEPRDVVFAGADRSRAFITTAHRGQNTGRDPQLTTPGIGRADVWVFDAANLGASLGGDALSVLTLFCDTPRALTVSPDGNTVYAAAFHSGNRSTTVHERLVTNNGFLPPPNRPAGTLPGPLTGLIVKYGPSADGTSHWLDGIGRIWDAQVKFSLPDKDVFAIDANANPPAETTVFTGVGTVLFNMAVNPVSGKVYVANTEARNVVRFEGHNVAGGTGSVRGHIAESRITVLDGAGAHPRHLNKHLDYSRDGTPEEADTSVAFPTEMAVTRDGKTLYVAAFGSSKLGIYDTSELENDTFVPSKANSVELTGGGPTGVVLDEANGALYALTRFDNSISVVDTKTGVETSHVAMFNPEPQSIVKGRRFLYDARTTSSHGDSACASCHVFGDMDSLAWDLGDPDGAPQDIPGPFTLPLTAIFPPGAPNPKNSNLKGPMTTQSLRGMANHGPMHWRGDRTGGNAAPSAQPNSGTFDEDAAFKAFNVAFPGLLGSFAPLSPSDLQAFTDFILQVTYPPNPVRNLDDSLTPDQAAGRAFFFNHVAGTNQEIPSDTFRNCNGCHVLDRDGNSAFGVPKPGFFGSDGKYSFESEPQFMKVPHLRNMYQKVGMFGMANTWRLPIDSPVAPLLSFLPGPLLNDNSFKGDQIRGFGYTHDGSVDTLFRFFSGNVFVQRPAERTAENPFPNPGGIPPTAAGVMLRRQLEAFVLAFDSNLAPIVGQQTTLTSDNAAVVSARLTLLESRARAGDCELVVTGQINQQEVSWLYDVATLTFVPNRASSPRRSFSEVQALAAAAPLTFTAVPRGSGQRMALDRDGDGVLNGDDANAANAALP